MGRQWLHAKRAIVNLKKGQTVGKLVKEITVAAKLGGGDLGANARLFAAARTADATDRARQLQEAEALMLASAPSIPLYYNTHVFLLQPSVKGWHPTLLDHHPYKAVWLEE